MHSNINFIIYEGSEKIMAMLCDYEVPLRSGVGTHDLTFCVNPVGTNVHVSMEVGRVGTWEFYDTWTMELQRRAHGDFHWYTVGQPRTGYLSTSSPSHRTFNAVATLGTQMSVLVYFDDIQHIQRSRIWNS
jgi:hypothetical protein